MTIAEIEARLTKIEEAIATDDLSFNRFLMLAGEWEGLSKSIGRTQEGAWNLLNRLRGI